MSMSKASQDIMAKGQFAKAIKMFLHFNEVKVPEGYVLELEKLSLDSDTKEMKVSWMYVELPKNEEDNVCPQCGRGRWNHD